MIELTAEQRQAIINGKPVRLQPVEIGRNVILLLEDEFERLQRLLEEEREDRVFQSSWQKLAYRGLTIAEDDEP